MSLIITTFIYMLNITFNNTNITNNIIDDNTVFRIEFIILIIICGLILCCWIILWIFICFSFCLYNYISTYNFYIFNFNNRLISVFLNLLFPRFYNNNQTINTV